MEDFLDLENIDEALKVNVGLKLKRLTMAAFKLRDNWNRKAFINGPHALDVNGVALEHMGYASFYFFKKRVQKGDIQCPQNQKNLTNLCKLYGLNNLYKDSRTCYECGYFENKPYSQWILDAIKVLNKEIRPAALNIVEAFEIPDEVL